MELCVIRMNKLISPSPPLVCFYASGSAVGGALPEFRTALQGRYQVVISSTGTWLGSWVPVSLRTNGATAIDIFIALRPSAALVLNGKLSLSVLPSLNDDVKWPNAAKCSTCNNCSWVSEGLDGTRYKSSNEAWPVECFSKAANVGTVHLGRRKFRECLFNSQ